MNILYKLFSAVLVMAMSLALAVQVNAQEEEATPPSDEELMEEMLLSEIPEGYEEGEELQVTVLSEIEVEDARVLEYKQRDFLIEFEIKNNGDVQPGVIYAVELYKKMEDGDVLVDQRLYEEELTVRPGDTIVKRITYTAPTYFEGEHVLMVVLVNNLGTKYAGSALGTYSLLDDRTLGQFFISPSTCILAIEGKENGFSIGQGVDVDPESETLLIGCRSEEVVNDETLAPVFTYHERSYYQGKVSEERVLRENMKIVNNDFGVPVPIPSKPQSYLATLAFYDKDNRQVSNAVPFRFVTQGESASIKNVSFDKVAYSTGEEALVKVYVSGYADIFPEARVNDAEEFDVEASTRQLTLRVQLESNGVACSAPFEDTFPVFGAKLHELRVPITADCSDPSAQVHIVTPENDTLSEGDFSVQNEKDISTSSLVTTNPGMGGMEMLTIIVIIILVFVVIGLYIIYQRKSRTVEENADDSSNNTPHIPPIAMLIIVLCFGLLSAGNVHAVYFQVNLLGIQPIIYEGNYSLDDSSVSCGGNITGRADMWVGACLNSAINMSLNINGGGAEWTASSPTVCNDAISSCGNTSYSSGPRSATRTNVTSDGSMPFSWTVSRPTKSFTHTYTPPSPVTYTVSACNDFDRSHSVTSCARTDDLAKVGSVDVSITNTTGAAVASYGFECGGQPEVIQASNNYTCVFDDPGSYDIRFRTYNGSGTELNEETENNVQVLPCACDTTGQTSSFTVNGVSAVEGAPAVSANITNGQTFSVQADLNSPEKAYECSVNVPAMPPESQPSQLSILADPFYTYSNPGHSVTAASAGTYNYTFQCTHPDSTCSDINYAVDATLVSSPMTVTINVPDPINVGQQIDWVANISGGAPDYTNHRWVINGVPYNSPAVSGPGNNVSTVPNLRFGSENPALQAQFWVDDAWGNSTTTTRTIQVIDNRIPQ